MRILSITAQKPSSTGSGVFLTEMVASFARQGHAQAVVFGRMPDDPVPFDGDATVATYPVQFEGDSLGFPIAGMSDDMPYAATRYCDFTAEMLASFRAEYARVIQRAIDEFAPDLIVCHHLYIVASVAAHLEPLCPIVAICHGTDIRQMGKHDLCNDYVREGMQRMDRLFALTSDQASAIAECFKVDPTRISVLGTGYNSHIFFPNDAPDHERDKNSVLFVGKVCEKKGVRSLIRAVNLAPRQDDLHVRLVGGFSDQEEHRLIEQEAQQSEVPVQLMGKVPQDVLVERYQHAQMFVLPSFFEGLPLVLIEAMACGCVVVATDLPGVRPWLADMAPDAPILFVEPPRMRNVDEPLPEDLPRFERDIADAISRAFQMEGNPGAVAHLSWDALVKRLVSDLGL